MSPPIFIDIPFNKSKDNAVLQANVTSSTPFLDDMKGYSVSVHKMAISLSTLPIFIPELSLQNVATPNETIYYVMMTHCSDPTTNLVDWVSPKIHLSFNPEAGAPVWTDNTKQPGNEYAFLYSYDSIAQMINQAFQTAKTSLPAPPTAIPNFRFYYDESAGKFSLLLQGPSANWITTVPTQMSRLNFYISENMKFMFNGFQTVLDKYTVIRSPANPVLGEAMYRLVTNAKPNNWLYAETNSTTTFISWAPGVSNSIGNDDPTATNMSTAATAFTVSQNWSPLNFNPIQSIMVTTSLPIQTETTMQYSNLPQFVERTEYYVKPDGTSASYVNHIALQNSFAQSVLTDVNFDTTVGLGSGTTCVVYNQSTIELSRRVQLLSGGPLYSFGVAVYWVDCYNNIRPLSLNSKTEVCALKLAFFQE